MRRVALGVVALTVGLAGCSADDPAGPDAPPDLATLEPGTLTACVAPGPGTAVETDAGLEGFDVAVLGDVADELGLDLDVVTTSFDEVVSGVALNGGVCDVAAGAVVGGPALGDVVTTSAPYRTVHRLVVAPGTPATVEPEAVTGVVGVEEAGAALDVVDQLPSAEVFAYPSRVDLGRALEVGAVGQALVTVAGRASMEDQLGVPLAVVAAVPTERHTVLLLPLDGDDELASAIDAAIAALTADGRLDALVAAWLRA